MGEKEKDKKKPEEAAPKKPEGAPADAPAVKKRKLPKIKLLNIILIVVALLGVLSTLLTSFILTVPPENVEVHKEEKKAGAKEKKKEAAETVGGAFVLAPFVINLADQGGRRYLKVNMELETAEKETKELEKKLPYVRNIIINLLSIKNYDEIKSIEGKDQLRADIAKQVNEILTKTTVKNCFFTEFTVQ